MKKSILFFSALALLAGITSCGGNKKENGKIDLGGIVLDGFYVYGDATGTDKVESKFGLSSGTNEVTKELRAGMYEKYVWLEANKPFALIENKGGQKTFYGAELAEYNFGYDENDPNCKNFADNPNMLIQQGKLIIGENAPKMQVKEDGLYHIILDNNTAGDLPDGAQIVIQKADFGVRGGMNGWGFTEGEVSKADDGTITYTWKDQNLAKGGEFKFASCWGWKINLDLDNKVKAEVSLGLDNNGEFTNVSAGNIKVEKAGLYDITLTYKCAGGPISKSFSFTYTLTKESTTPTTLYMIGNDFGNWDWTSEGVVDMIPVHSHQGQFWAIRYLTTATEFKFSPNKDWNGAFKAQGANDSGFIAKGDNCAVEKEGLYMIFVDLEGECITVEPAAVFGMGDCFGNWDAGKNPFEMGKGASVVLPNTGNLRMYAECSKHASADWWQMEFNIFDGKIVYRADGGDQPAVAATAGQTVTLDFNAGTGSIK